MSKFYITCWQGTLAARVALAATGSGPRLYCNDCISARPFTAAEHDPIEDASTSAAWGIVMVVAGGPQAVGRSPFGVGGRARCRLLPSGSLRVVRVARAFVSVGAGRAVTGRGKSLYHISPL